MSMLLLYMAVILTLIVLSTNPLQPRRLPLTLDLNQVAVALYRSP